jgi:hypothetical protein
MAKEELWKLKYFTMPKYNLQKNPLKEIQNPSPYYKLIIFWPKKITKTKIFHQMTNWVISIWTNKTKTKD